MCITAWLLVRAWFAFEQHFPPCQSSPDGWLQVDARRADRAERAKLKGNEAFKAGRYMDAIKAYSEALQLQPNHPVYASNRAMAYLKIFRWGPLPLGLLIARLACCSASS